MIFGHPFLPSQAYVSSHDMIAKSVAIPVGCLMLFFCCRKFAKDFQSPNLSTKTFLVSGFGILVVPLVFGVFARAIVLTAYPLWLAAVAGRDTQLEFSIGDITGSSMRCPYRVDLADMPIMTGTLCDVPEAVRKTLYPGMRVLLTGRGTVNGLFAARINVAPSGQVLPGEDWLR
ncbi:hypothetical protein [Mesorhizobium sp. B1-1-8]|uniref:hypothetical protein n=1 Tax=Mesorhizobium sp. B1-1-8 TaxID=2589976 RepID=UPI001129BC59|nr:hypothetical protein [Mesorhizobium sp. B1-1-8]UCI09459.1 hypothetical protein FJ974_10530 [Mesorhizobium sp. B1-1-8]